MCSFIALKSFLGRPQKLHEYPWASFVQFCLVSASSEPEARRTVGSHLTNAAARQLIFWQRTVLEMLQFVPLNSCTDSSTQQPQFWFSTISSWTRQETIEGGQLNTLVLYYFLEENSVNSIPQICKLLWFQDLYNSPMDVRKFDEYERWVLKIVFQVVG